MSKAVKSLTRAEIIRRLGTAEAETETETEVNYRLLQKDRDTCSRLYEECNEELLACQKELAQPIPMLLWCPFCGFRHVDEGEWATRFHHTHACQSCGGVWRPAVKATVGVQFLPGFKNSSIER